MAHKCARRKSDITLSRSTPTISIGEADKRYIGAALRSVWFYVSVLFGLLGLLERWFALHLLIPHWAIISFLVLSLTLAQFEAYKKKFIEAQTLQKQLNERGELETLKKIEPMQFDFLLHVDHALKIPILMRMSPYNNDNVEIPVLSITVWNKGKDHFRVTSCILRKGTTMAGLTRVKTDMTAQPTPAPPSEMDVTRELIAVLADHEVPVNWGTIHGPYQVQVGIEGKSDNDEPGLFKSEYKTFDVRVDRTGKLALHITVSPHSEN